MLGCILMLIVIILYRYSLGWFGVLRQHMLEEAQMDRQKLEECFRQLDRSIFIDNEYKELAHLDSALPIGFEQTISQPTLVREMTYLLSPEKDSRVLEIGTGSGYQTALLAEFAGEVYTIERIEELAVRAREKLEALGFTNIHFKIGDGSEGWEECSPFDRIIVTAAAGNVPRELIEQLAPGGRMVIPVGPRGWQELKLITKDQSGTINSQTVTEVTFVEMKGKYGWRK